jgi:hypothetical protein
MTATVRISRATAERAHRALVAAYSFTATAERTNSAAIDELLGALADDAEASAWAPFAQVVVDLHAQDRQLSPVASSNLDELAAHIRDDFDHAGVDLTDPLVQRSILLALSCATKYSYRLHAAGSLSCTEAAAIPATNGPIAVAVARMIPPEAFA